MGPLAIAGILAAAGLIKSYAVDKPKEERERKLASDTQRYSPWTGIQAGKIDQADPFGTALQYGATGAMLGQGIEDHEANQMLQQKNSALMDSEIMRNNAAANASSGSIRSPDAVRGVSQPSLYAGQVKKNPWDLGINAQGTGGSSRFTY